MSGQESIKDMLARRRRVYDALSEADRRTFDNYQFGVLTEKQFELILRLVAERATIRRLRAS